MSGAVEPRRAQEDGDEFKRIRRGGCLGDATFRKELLESAHTRATESHPAETRRETAEEKARRILQEELDKLGWMGAELSRRAKGDARKIRIARRLRTETSVTLKWIATELHLGTWTHVANRLQKATGQTQSQNQNELSFV